MREVVIGGAIIWLIWELRWVLFAIVILDFLKWCFEEIGAGIAAAYHAIVAVFRYFETQNRVWLLVAFAAGGMVTELVCEFLKTRFSRTERNRVRMEPFLDAPASGESASRSLPHLPRFEP
jgi:hypothetical protein